LIPTVNHGFSSLISCSLKTGRPVRTAVPRFGARREDQRASGLGRGGRGPQAAGAVGALDHHGVAAGVQHGHGQRRETQFTASGQRGMGNQVGLFECQFEPVVCLG